MPVPTLISQLSTTASLNSPDGAVDVPSSIDDYQRAHAAFIAQLYAGTVAAPTVIVPSATTTDIGAAASENVDISGNTTITGFGTVAEGINRKGRFTGVLTLTHNATSLILPGNANITTAANDRYEARSLGGGNWIVTKYQYASGLVQSVDIQNQTVTKFTTGGTSTAFTGAPNPPVTSNAAGQRFTATLHTAPTGSPTLAVSGLTALNFKYRDAAGIKQFVTSAQAPSGYPCDVLNDGTDWVLMNPIVRGMTATIGGLVPTPPNNTTTFLRGDGTFAAPSTVIFASAAETSAGTETTKAVNPSGLAQSTLGAAGQTWQDVTGSRANNTTYTNSTNRPIMVAIQGGGGGSAVTFTINGHTLYSSVQGIGAGSFAFSFIVPVGNSYSANSTTGSLAKWLELR